MLFKCSLRHGKRDKGDLHTKKGISHTSTLINMLVQENKGELESWSGKECTCLCFQDGEMLRERLAYWHWELPSWHLTVYTMFAGSFYPAKLQEDLLAPRIPDRGGINTSEDFWEKVSSTAFLLCPFLPCLIPWETLTTPTPHPSPVLLVDFGEHTVIASVDINRKNKTDYYGLNLPLGNFVFRC